MNVHAVEKKTILIKTEEFVKYETDLIYLKSCIISIRC